MVLNDLLNIYLTNQVCKLIQDQVIIKNMDYLINLSLIYGENEVIDYGYKDSKLLIIYIK